MTKKRKTFLKVKFTDKVDLTRANAKEPKKVKDVVGNAKIKKKNKLLIVKSEKHESQHDFGCQFFCFFINRYFIKHHTFL